MKKILIILSAALVALTGCGMGNVSVSSGKADEAYLSFSAATHEAITVTVDGKDYQTETIKVQGWSNNKDLKDLSGSVIKLEPGTHEVLVKNKKGEQVYQKKIFVSAQEHKLVQL